MCCGAGFSQRGCWISGTWTPADWGGSSGCSTDRLQTFLLLTSENKIQHDKLISLSLSLSASSFCRGYDPSSKQTVTFLSVREQSEHKHFIRCPNFKPVFIQIRKDIKKKSVKIKEQREPGWFRITCSKSDDARRPFKQTKKALRILDAFWPLLHQTIQEAAPHSKSVVLFCSCLVNMHGAATSNSPAENTLHVLVFFQSHIICYSCTHFQVGAKNFARSLLFTYSRGLFFGFEEKCL